METPELLGGFKLNAQGGMDWIPGPITLAAKNDGWVLIDEGDLLDPAALAGLNAIAEGRPFLIPETGELVTPGPNFRLFLTANTNGGGDATGLYQGALRLNLAFMDRFYIAEFGYPAEETEISIIAKLFPSITEEIRARMVAFANDIRGLFVKGETEVTLSTRTLLRWAKITTFIAPAAAKTKGAPNPLSHALDRALGFRAEATSRKGLHEVLQRHFGQ
jgi:cobaltochelatase CobS